jgi:Cof subfamily protein (haloacid dehalogenase superfamily)
MHTPTRLIGIDLDDTLLRRDEFHPDDLAALAHARQRGVPVIVATGRSHFSSQPVVDRLGLDSPHVSYNGSWILSPHGELMRDLRVPVDLAREILRRCEQMEMAVRIFLPDVVLMNREPGPDEQFFKYRPFERVDKSVADTLSVPPVQMVIVHLDDVSAFASEFSGTQIEQDLYWLVNGRDPETPHLWALHVLNKGGMKSLALAQLCDEWRIDPANVLTFGDGPNDVDMLEWAGTGVSFPWGYEPAKAAANVITAPGDPHPIATVLYEWLESGPLGG